VAEDAEDLPAPDHFVEQQVEEREDERVERPGSAGRQFTRVERETVACREISSNGGVDPRVVKGIAPLSRDSPLSSQVEPCDQEHDESEQHRDAEQG
jgi:hypothetical protein